MKATDLYRRHCNFQVGAVVEFYHDNFRIRAVICAVVILFLPLIMVRLALPQSSEEVAQIRIVHRDVNEMFSMAQPLVSKYGFISADAPSNSLIVIDHPAYVARIREFVSRIDQPVPQLTIHVKFKQQDRAEEQSAAATGNINVGDAAIEVGDRKKDKIEVEVQSDQYKRRDQGEYRVIVKSGSTAYISSGYDVPYPERWSHLSRKHGYVSRPVTFKKVDTGYDVRPVLVGNNVQVEITPRISYLTGRGLRQPVRFAEAATRLNVPLGEWVEIAGTDASHQEINREILGVGSASGTENLVMQMMVTRN